MNEEENKNCLIVGLGNIGDTYKITRHNIGFIFLDEISKNLEISFEECEYSLVAKFREGNVNVTLIKPTTYMNNSGLAVKYWKEWFKIKNENIMVIVDDLHLKLGELRFRNGGSAGGHNGLKNIENNIGDDYARLRIGIGNNFEYGKQDNFVLENFNKEEYDEIIKKSADVMKIAEEFIKNNDGIIRQEKINRIINNRVISSVG